MSALTLHWPGHTLTLHPGQFTPCPLGDADPQALAHALASALQAHGQIVLGLPASGGLLSLLTVADNLTLAARYHELADWPTLDRQLPALLQALAVPEARWPALMQALPQDLSPAEQRVVLLLRARLTPGAAWVIDSGFFSRQSPSERRRSLALLTQALPGRYAVWLSHDTPPDEGDAQHARPA